MKKILAVGSVIGLMFALSSCAVNSEQNEVSPVTKTEATNVQTVEVEGMGTRIFLFDVKRDGKILTCSSKDVSYAGVSCFPKE